MFAAWTTFVFSVVLGCTAAAGDRAEAWVIPAGLSTQLCDKATDSLDCATRVERASLGLTAEGVRRDGKNLMLTLASGDVIVLSDEPEGAYHRYYGRLPFGDDVVYVQERETGHYLIVQRRDGAIAKLEGYPIISPDLSRVLTMSSGSEGLQVDLEIWRVTDSGLVPEWSRRIEHPAEEADGRHSSRWTRKDAFELCHWVGDGQTQWVAQLEQDGWTFESTSSPEE